MKFLIFFPIIFMLVSCGEGGDTDLVLCTVNVNVDCGSDPTLDDEVESAGLSCDRGDICGTSTDIDAVVALDGDLGDLLATAKFRPQTSDFREPL